MALNSTKLTERLWNRLLKAIEEGQVIPVIGSELSTWHNQDHYESFQAKIAKKVLEFYGIDAGQAELKLYRELNETVSILKENNSLQDLYSDIAEAIESITTDPDFKIPESISKLAQISSFRLIVTLTPDNLIASALQKHANVKEYIHSPNLPTSEATDLSVNWLKQNNEVHLLYLFGKAKSTPVFAIHDEDILEYAHNLIARGSNVPLRFLGEIQQRSLLFIGSNYPDWLSRFFLRLTNQTRLSDKKTRAWLVEDVEAHADFISFIQSFSKEIEVVAEIKPHIFIDELYERWSERNPHDNQPTFQFSENKNDVTNSIFFISYSRNTDLAAAENFFTNLKKLGVSEQEIWFDRQSIEPGGNFHNLIDQGIRSCRYFIPLISSEADRYDEKYFYREWNLAIDRNQGISGREFVIPVILDENYAPQSYQRVPRVWCDNIDFGHAPKGEPDMRTKQRLTSLIRAMRREDRE